MVFENMLKPLMLNRVLEAAEGSSRDAGVGEAQMDLLREVVAKRNLTATVVPL